MQHKNSNCPNIDNPDIELNSKKVCPICYPTKSQTPDKQKRHWCSPDCDCKQNAVEEWTGLEKILRDWHYENIREKGIDVIKSFISKTIKQQKLQELRGVRNKLKDTDYADGFVGFTDEEWNGVKKFLPIYISEILENRIKELI